ncbi:regulatory protein RecX [Microbulbifer sp. HZ11]|uniref:regulatory protein RecX n=1 Tax=unclassified Microbulbifer TaxID=2619833 RepID=UPI001E571E7E|nr:regulatory protein RecX [Microbulbifer sp. HZ11]
MSFLRNSNGGGSSVDCELPSPGSSLSLPQSRPGGRPQERPVDTFQALFNHALELLARREHSCEELRQKLAPKHPEADFDSVLQRLQELNYQCDRRFAETFCRSRVSRGQGPIRIRQELQVRGIRGVLAQEVMEALQEEVDWFELALEQLQRKFRQPLDLSQPREQQLKERARRQRYLAYRGFSGDAIQYAIEELNSPQD